MHLWIELFELQRIAREHRLVQEAIKDNGHGKAEILHFMSHFEEIIACILRWLRGSRMARIHILRW